MDALSPAERPSPIRVTLAWGVHLFTASGAFVGAAALLAIAEGELQRAALLMLVALSIDSVDGALARKARVRDVLPDFDGRRLDDMVDYLNYAVVPAVFMVFAGSLAGWAVSACPVLASAYGFSRTDAKTEDDFFLGFPSYWNVIALYLWRLDLSPAAGTAIVVAFAALVFVPVKYVYPSRMPVLQRTTSALAAVWLIVLAAAVVWPQIVGERALWISLAFPIYYGALSLRLGGLARRTR